MSERFQHLLFPGTATVLGRELPPLSLWSLSVLQAVRSPLLQPGTGNREPRTDSFTLADLQVAVRCALTPVLSAPDLRPTFRERLLWRRRHKNRAYLDVHAAAFVQWLAAHQNAPVLWEQENHDCRFLSAPVGLSLVAALMQLGMSHLEAWSCSPGYARWILLAAAERSSDSIHFAEDDDEDDNLPLDDEMTEEAIIAQARADLPPAAFAAWLQSRKERGHSCPQ